MTQKEKVLKHLKRSTLTSMEAFAKYNITRLAAVIQELRHEGNAIITNIKVNKKSHYAIYKLEK
jgi:hypothetical protein